MKNKTLLLGALLLSSWAHASTPTNAADIRPDPILGSYLSPHGPASAESLYKLKRNKLNQDGMTIRASGSTYTYLRCYYATGTKLRPTTNYVWALNTGNNDYYRIYGSWWSSSMLAWKNMFYSDTSQDTLKSVCQSTLSRKGLGSNVAMWAAADNSLSFNYTVWSQDSAAQLGGINRIVAFGDSLSDTQNMYNASQWLLPNRNSWFLGRFSNGNNWVEYLADSLRLPLYNWAVGGAGVNTEKYVIAGVTDQVQSYKEYMQKAAAYRPEKTLFTVLIGGNDFVNYDRSVDQVIAGETSALQNLLNTGARNVLLLKLPDVSKAPVFKIKGNPALVAAKVLDYNNRLDGMIASLRAQYGSSLNIRVFDTYTLFNSVLNSPASYGMTNTTSSCLNINSDSSLNYLSSQSPRSECSNPDTFVFWDTLHPTTRTHKLLSENVAPFVRAAYPVPVF
ncbi:SGNH/GDSL hydrolase family protein [Chitinimonas sp. JJ19]|uniref:SGNH/GDSL hydrolase family protein n=1 Tax=Chitinimonas sp. JJ19 TaxID=3109352 RepID=UPI003002F99B